MELNAEQIKKALEICWIRKSECDGCPYLCPTNACLDKLESDVIALITEQEQRIGELTEENESLKDSNEHLAVILAEETEYKERLQGILLQFTDIVYKWGNKYGYDTSEISLVPVIYEANTIKSQIEADTVRKMRERLCEGRVSNDPVVIAVNVAAKEMLESENL